MTTLNQAVTAMLDARKVSNEAKERWLKLMRESSDEQGTAKQTFLAADNDCSLRANELGKVMTDLKAISCLEIAIDALPGELKQAFYRVVAELRFDQLLAPVKLQGLEAVAAAWRNAGAMLDAAKALVQRCRREDADTEFETLRKESESYRNPDAWLKTVTVVELLFDTMRNGAEERRERIEDAAYAANRHLQKAYDKLVEALQEELEELNDAGVLGASLNDMEDHELRRALQSALGGLIRQRQMQPETQRQSRPVTTLDPATEAEAEADADVDPDSN